MDELLKAIKAFVSKEGASALSDDEATKLAEELRGSPITQPVYQNIFDSGHASATKRSKTKESDLETQIEEKDKEIEKLNKKVKRLEEDKPDVAAIEAKHTERVQELEQKLDEEQKARKEDRINWHRERAQKDLAAALVAQGVNPKWARYQAEQEAVTSRIRVVEDGDKVHVEVLKKGSETLPLQADNPVQALAEELEKEIEPEFKTSKVKGGSGSRQGATGDAGKGDVFQRAREAGSKVNESRKGATEDAAAKRLGVLSK